MQAGYFSSEIFVANKKSKKKWNVLLKMVVVELDVPFGMHLCA